MAGDVLDGAGHQVIQAVLSLLQLDLLGVGGGGGVNGLKGSGFVSQGLDNNKIIKCNEPEQDSRNSGPGLRFDVNRNLHTAQRIVRTKPRIINIIVISMLLVLS